MLNGMIGVLKMNSFRIRFLSLVLFSILLFPHVAYSQEDKDLYHQGTQAARQGNVDFAFMRFYRLLNNFPDSKYIDQALFAVGEYYFLVGDHHDAIQAFNRLINEFPKSEAKPFAIAYLLNLANRQGNEVMAGALKKELIASQQLSLVFKDFEERKYISPLNQSYRFLHFIDRVEIYIYDQLLSEISF